MAEGTQENFSSSFRNTVEKKKNLKIKSKGNCRVLCVKVQTHKYYILWIRHIMMIWRNRCTGNWGTMRKICNNTGFIWPVYSRIRTKSSFCLYTGIYGSKKTCILAYFYAVEAENTEQWVLRHSAINTTLKFNYDLSYPLEKTSSNGVDNKFLVLSWTSTASPLHNYPDFITSWKGLLRCFKNLNGLRVKMASSVVINKNHR